jgi:6-phosphogluconolactonase (cycloisomerase 2 family)
MKRVREFSQSLLILVVGISLVNCSGGTNCDFGGADRPALRGASALPPCPNPGGGGGGACSTTQTPSAALFSMDSTGTFLIFDISSTNPPLVQICNAVAGTLGPITITQPIATAPFLYVLNAAGTTGKIGAFAIAGTKSAALTAVSGQPFSISADTFTTGVNITSDPSGNFVFVTNAVTGKIHVFKADLQNLPTLGALTEVAGSPFSVTHVSSIAVDISESFAYATDPVNGQITIFTIDSGTGVLTLAPINPNPMQIGSATDFPNFVLTSFQSTSDHVFVYTANASSVSAYIINADGSLTALAPPYTDAATLGIKPIFLVADGAITTGPSDIFVMSSNTKGILGYQVTAGTGALTLAVGSPFLEGTSVNDIAINGESMYVLEASGGGAGGTINPFSINTTTGGLTALTQTTTFTTSTNLATANTQ